MKIIATLSFALVWTLATHAQGLIWSASHTSIGGNEAGAGPLPDRQIALDHTSDPNFTTPPSLNPVSGIFSMTLSTNDAGRTFFANALNAPGFGGFVSGLTDGANGYIRFQIFDSSFWERQNERDYLGRPLLTPDFAGYNITQIGFRVNNYYDWFYEPESRYLNTLDYSLDFFGSPVPEPSTWALFSLGGAAALLLRRKARRHG